MYVHVCAYVSKQAHYIYTPIHNLKAYSFFHWSKGNSPMGFILCNRGTVTAICKKNIKALTDVLKHLRSLLNSWGFFTYLEFGMCINTSL